MSRYQVYGLSLEAELPLPELVGSGAVNERSQPGEVDVRVRRVAPGELEGARAHGEEPASWVERLANGDTLSRFEDVGSFLVRDGREVLVDALPGADPGLVRHLLLGPVLAQLLWQRGLFALHASVLRIEARAAGEDVVRQIAFVGVSGEGKSTTAAALHAAGHTLVCDDVAALDWQSRPVLVRPGFPRMRLYADTLANVGERSAELVRVHASLDKHLLPARRFACGAAPLERIYVLESGEACSAAPLGAREGMLELMRHTYYAEQFAPLHGIGAHMKMASQVALQVPMFRLRRPRELARLPELVRFLEQHVLA